FLYSPDEILNKPVGILQREDAAETHQKRLERFLNKGVGQCGHIGRRVERTFRRKDGTYFEAAIAMSGGRSNGKRLVVVSIHDITERKKAEKALKESEASLSKAQKVAKLGSWESNLVTGAGKWSKECSRLFGFDAQDMDITYEDFQKFLHPDDKEVVLTKVAEAIKNREDYEGEYRIIGKDNKVRYVYSKSQMEFDKSGKPKLLRGIIQDITERKHAEEELKETKAFLDNIVSSAPDAIITVDLKDSITSFSPAAETMFGYKAEDMIGKSILKLYPKRQRKKRKRWKEKLLKEGRLDRFGTKQIKANGKTFDVSLSMALLKDAEDRPIGIVSVSHDITERKHMEEALLESEEHFRSVVQTASDGIISLDNHGDIVSWNPAADTIFGYLSDEAVGKPLTFFMPERFRKAHQNGIKRLVSTRKAKIVGKTVEMTGLRKNGREFPLELSLATWKTKSRTFFTGIVRDITERKRAEEEMKRRLMKYRLDDGSLYLVKESKPTLSLMAFDDLLKIGYSGFIISRTPEKKFKKAFKGNLEFLWISEQRGEKTLSPYIDKIGRKIESLPRGSAIFIERLDYLVFKNGLKETLSFVQRLRELAYLCHHVVILSVDPSTFDKRELRLLEKETEEIEPMQKARLPEDLLETLRFVYKQNNVGVKPSYTDVCGELGISKPTVRKRIRRLVSSGHLRDIVKGNRKVLELTENGRNLFSE
ncbi:MAG: PAS domain S-box protein, partial [Candidatus Hydrothermarchaeales archaeon]